MDPTNPPSPWVYEPDDVKIDTWADIPVPNYWRNPKTGEILVQFRTETAVRRNKYVEKHTDPDKVKSRFRQLKNALSRGTIETELESVTATGGRGIAKCAKSSEALQEAFEYMEDN